MATKDPRARGGRVERAPRSKSETTLGANGMDRSEERLQVIVESALDAVITMDDTGSVTGWNPSAERIFGWTAAEIIGHQLSLTIVPPRHRAAHEAGLRRYRQTAEGPVLGKVIEITGLHRDGHEFPVELAIS